MLDCMRHQYPSFCLADWEYFEWNCHFDCDTQMNLSIPIKPIPAQVLSVVLSQQRCTITLQLRGDHLYFSLEVGGVQIVRNRIIRDRATLSGDEYLGLTGQIYMADTQGKSDPEYTGLGSRWVLIYEE